MSTQNWTCSSGSDAIAVSDTSTTLIAATPGSTFYHVSITNDDVASDIYCSLDGGTSWTLVGVGTRTWDGVKINNTAIVAKTATSNTTVNTYAEAW